MQMGLEKDNYIFVREVAGISMNYSDLDSYSSLYIIKYIHEKGMKIVLSLEDKSTRDKYEPYCIILEEPLEDLY